MRALSIIAVCAFVPALSWSSGEPSDLAAALLSRSTAVVVAESRDDDGDVYGSGENHVLEAFDVKRTLAGALSDATVTVVFVRSVRDEVHPHKKGIKLILFLKRVPNALPPWYLVDDDLGAIPYTYRLEQRILQLAATSTKASNQARQRTAGRSAF